MDHIVNDLRGIKTFEDLNEDDLMALSGICQATDFPPRSIIAREGFDAESLFALTAGTVGIWVEHGSDDADLLAVIEAPCLVGEMAVADQLPRSATIVSGSPVAGYTINADSFRKLLQERGSIALSLMKGISRIVRNSNDSFVSELRGRNDELQKANEELKEAHRQLVRQERLSSLGRFSSMIIHDLRNPLSVIRGYADMLELKLGEKNAELQRYASQVKRETARLSGLTSEWLDYSRGEIRLAYSAITIEDLFSQLNENVGPRLASKGIQFEMKDTFESAVMIDSERILRVMINLADNARKACRRDGRIKISASREGNYLIIQVEDDGVGMNNETLVHLFEPFYSTSDSGGTGLGMHIVKTVVEAHEGNIAVTSSPGKGTEVRISLPLRM